MTETLQNYPITDSLGTCVIFNMETFSTGEPDRCGTNHDKLKIEMTFSKFGYDVHTVQNPTTTEIVNKMKKVLGEDHKKSSSFICFLLSHGSSKNKIATDDGEIDLNDIIQMTNVPDLQGKPKIFVIQACRGGKFDSGMVEGTKDDMNPSPIEVDDMMLVPRNPDFLLIYATPPGYVSSRNPVSGSSFIQMFCHIMEQERSTATVCVLLQRLTMAISNIPIEFERKQGLFLQVPYFMSTLRRSLMLYKSTLGDIQFMTTDTIKDTQAEITRRRNGFFRSDFTNGLQAYFFLLRETHGCYDVSSKTDRHCLVINKTTNFNQAKAGQDCKMIKETLTALKFKVNISNGCDTWKDELERLGTEQKNVGCLFCFIQIDSDNGTSDNKFVAEVIESVKRKNYLLNKPKVYIIQPYQIAAVSETDSINEHVRTHPVRHSREADVLMVHVMPVTFGKKSFITMFCDEYVENAGKVPMMGFLERVLPGKYERDWISLVPTVCSTMRKHLIMKDSFTVDSYKTEYIQPIEAVLDVVNKLRNFFR